MQVRAVQRDAGEHRMHVDQPGSRFDGVLIDLEGFIAAIAPRYAPFLLVEYNAWEGFSPKPCAIEREIDSI